MGKRLSVWLPDDLAEQVDLAAQIEDRSKNEIVVRALKQVLQPPTDSAVEVSRRLAILQQEGLSGLRHSLGLSQREVAHAIGCTLMSVSQFERRGIRPRDDLITELAELYGIPEEELRKHFKREQE